jgi:hypothetical protein
MTNQKQGTKMSMRWLWAKAPGFYALPEADRGAIFNFTFLWSLFEAQVMGNFARADLICTKVDEWRDAGTLDADQYAPERDYFRQRYFANGAFTHHFPHLNLRPADQPGIVQSVLDGNINDPRDRLLTVLMMSGGSETTSFTARSGRIAQGPTFEFHSRQCGLDAAPGTTRAIGRVVIITFQDRSDQALSGAWPETRWSSLLQWRRVGLATLTGGTGEDFFVRVYLVRGHPNTVWWLA